MKKIFTNEPHEILVSEADLENANLNEWESLELHLLDQAAVVIPGRMNVTEVVRTAQALQDLASTLLSCIGAACEKCDGCHTELLCDLMHGDIKPEVSVPVSALEEAGLDPNCKLTYEADSETGVIYLVEADHQYDLTDLPADLLDTLRECGVCLSDLEVKLMEEDIVYGTEG